MEQEKGCSFNWEKLIFSLINKYHHIKIFSSILSPVEWRIWLAVEI